MSGIKDFFFGTEGEAARVDDIRTPEQIALGNQLTSFLSGALESGGLPGFTGPSAAPITGLESSLLGGLEGLIGNTSRSLGLGLGQNRLNQITAGNTLSPLLTLTGGLPGVSQEAAQSIGDLAAGRTLDPNNPIIQNQITAATRPIFEAFDQNLGNLRSAATQAGQFVQPGSSSPFELARARLQSGVANAVGDTASRIVTENVNRERDRQQNLFGLLGNAFESGQERALRAANAQVPFQSGQIGALNNALSAAALPRLITQLGLDRGQQEFGRQQNTLLQLLNSAMGQASPQLINIPGTEGTSGFLQPLLGAAGAAVGGPLGGALAGLIPGVEN